MTGSRTITATAVNIGKAEPLAGRSRKTGIFKQPQTGPVMVTADGLAGDRIVDRRNHGGVDQAVYVFTQPDYAWWSVELGRDLPPGTFGENLIVTDLESAHLRAGDRLTFGPVTLELTSPRIPCATLAARMGDPGFARRFYRAGRTGFYTRVISGGPLSAGDVGRHDPYPGATVTMAEMVDNFQRRQADPDFRTRALAAPVHYKLRAELLPEVPPA